MPITRIKICGLTREADIDAAAAATIDAIGLNFFAGPRKIHLQRGCDLARHAHKKIAIVGLTSGPTDRFPDAPFPHDITHCAKNVALFHAIQFYGSHRPDMPHTHWWTVCGITLDTTDANALAQQILTHACTFSPNNTGVNTLVLDAKTSDGQLGGTGKSLNWNLLADALHLARNAGFTNPIALAGGLRPDNVALAIRILHPDWVDVSSGVESPSTPGLKDHAMIKDFAQAVHSI